MPDEEASVLRFSKESMLPAANLLFGSDDTAALKRLRSSVAVGGSLHSRARPGGKVIYKTIGSVDLLEMRRRFWLHAFPTISVSTNTGLPATS